MASPDLYALLAGMVSMGSLVAGFVFLRYWRRSRDRLFMYFCIAFFVDAAVRVGQALLTVPSEHEAFIYLPRLATFALIAWAIVDKNRRHGAASKVP
jgi:Family of unknown function (DUF5985)